MKALNKQSHKKVNIIKIKGRIIIINGINL